MVPGFLPVLPLLRDERLLRATLRREPLLSLTESLAEALLPVASLSRTMLSYPLLTILFLLEKYRDVFPIAGGKSPLNTLVVSLACPLRWSGVRGAVTRLYGEGSAAIWSGSPRVGLAVLSLRRSEKRPLTKPWMADFVDEHVELWLGVRLMERKDRGGDEERKEDIRSKLTVLPSGERLALRLMDCRRLLWGRLRFLMLEADSRRTLGPAILSFPTADSLEYLVG